LLRTTLTAQQTAEHVFQPAHAAEALIAQCMIEAATALVGHTLLQQLSDDVSEAHVDYSFCRGKVPRVGEVRLDAALASAARGSVSACKHA
jgi:hypothetical protein